MSVLSEVLPNLFSGMQSITCDKIWENPPYGIRAQCAFLVALVKNRQSSDLSISMSKNLSSNYYRRLRSLVVSYQGEISLYSQAPRSTWSMQLPFTESVAKGNNYLDTARFIEILNVDSPFKLLRHRRRSGTRYRRRSSTAARPLRSFWTAPPKLN